MEGKRERKEQKEEDGDNGRRAEMDQLSLDWTSKGVILKMVSRAFLYKG